MSNKTKQIDLLNRNSLIMLGKKIQIPGYTNNFSNPYRNMEYLKNAIQEEIKNRKKELKTRSKSVSDLSQNNNLNGNNSNSMNNDNISCYQGGYGGSYSKLDVGVCVGLRKSKSSSSISSMETESNILENNNLNINSADLLNKEFNSCIFPPQRKLVAIGDIHGDLSVAIKALKLAQVIDQRIPDDFLDVSKINWIGGNTFVVQLGDQIDRVRPSKLFNSLCTEEDEELYEDEGSDLKIIYLFERLNSQAQKQGGAVISILGNHELMNVDGDFRYVSPKEFREFGNRFNGKLEFDSSVPYGFKERSEAFKPGGFLARRLGKSRYSVVQVGSWLFVHGGITSECAKNYSLQKINEHIGRWLLGDISEKNMKCVHDLYHRDDDEHSPFWCRTYSDMEDWGQDALIEFNKTMNLINLWNAKNNDLRANGIVMGHSPQFMYGRGINSSINNRIWRVDVGASRAFGKVDKNKDANRLVQILVILNDGKNPNKDFQIIQEKG